jgi:signal transduction histidine kinase/DNA-binding response OmpR family regulator
MRLLLFVLCFICFCNSGIAQDHIYTHVISDESEKITAIGDSMTFLSDDSAQLDIQSILSSPDLKFSSADNIRSGKPFSIVWAKMRVLNQSNSIKHQMLHFCLDADSVLMFVVDSSRIITEYKSGTNLIAADKFLPVRYSFIPISLDPGVSRMLIFRIVYPGSGGGEHISHINIFEASEVIDNLVGNLTWLAFYTGIMVLFFVISLVMFAIFREKVFLYFAALMLSFALYFSYNNGLIQSFSIFPFTGALSFMGFYAVSAIVLSLYQFVISYIPLKIFMPWYSRFLLILTVLTAFVPYLILVFTRNSYFISNTHNYILLAWIIAMIYGIIHLSLRKDETARILLISIGVLFLGTLGYVISLLTLMPPSVWYMRSFQIGTVIFSGILFYNLFIKVRRIKIEKQEIAELDELKTRFFANISHEFRTPLTLMMGPLQQVIDTIENPSQKKMLEMAQRNAQLQLQLVNQLLDLTRLDAGKMQLKSTEINIVPLLKAIIGAYESLAQQRNIEVQLEFPAEELNVYFDPDHLEKIMYNILSNAFKFTGEGGNVRIELKSDSSQFELSVTDSGIGIPEDRLPFVFDRFFQVAPGNMAERSGTGIGLSLVKELVELNYGKISVESVEGEWTRMSMSFPLGKSHLKSDEIAETYTQAERSFPLVPIQENTIFNEDETEPSAKLSSILIIEDNPDLRMFIGQKLRNQFQIFESEDGEKGILAAIELVPDLIITDIMMPKKSGYEVCDALKNDLRTSHIPIIMLTAKAGRNEKLEGLRMGADDYLLKPFDAEELELRVSNLIQLRKQLRERFATSISLKPEEVTSNSIDQTFLEDALAIVERNMANESFSVDILASELNISRPNLNRKLRALVNQSSNQFIQTLRLQRAADLLKNQSGTVSEIAFQTGFSSTAYFIKCFKDHFGETPGNYLKSV